MSLYRKAFPFVLASALSIINLGCSSTNEPVNSKEIIGWNILSSNKHEDLKAINAAATYGVNHLQLSHKIINNLNDLRDPQKRRLVNSLVDTAHKRGIKEVVVWDHALYKPDYYPDKFKLKGSGKLNLDNPKLWGWIKRDYRNMLELAPGVDGVVLTFIETGTRIEDQYSEKLKTSSEKQAALIDSLASVIIDKLHLKLYIRTFVYNKIELKSILKSIELIKNPGVIVMCKETPHDFFITHPVSQWVQNIKLPVIIEFDCAHEFSGQSVVASIFPGIHFNRWEYYKSLPNVIGFSIRTDRFGTTSIIGRPSEINLFAIHSLTNDTSINMETVYNEFITRKYGKKLLKPVKAIFKMAPDIITSVYYTLGLNTANHSSINFDYRSIYTRHVSGRWMENPSISVDHGVNKEFHYWIDIVNHLSPAKYKTGDKLNMEEIPEVIANKWVQPEELMNEEYLSYVVTEKEYGKKLAAKAVAELKKIKGEFKDDSAYTDLYDTFERTELSADLFEGMAKVYYGYRIYGRGKNFRTSTLIKTIDDGMRELKSAVENIKNYDKEYPVGQYDWKKDADLAMGYYNKISESDFKKYLN